MEKTDNDIIAEFMGAKHRKETGPLTGNANWQTARYDTSWDWLMPVVEKINVTDHPAIQTHVAVVAIQGRKCRIICGSKRFKCHTLKTLNSVYQCVVQFIKWYNQQSK